VTSPREAADDLGPERRRGAVSDEAPTTLPTATTPAGGPSSSATERIGGIVAAPRRTFRALIDEERAGVLEPFLVYAVVVLALNAADTYRLLALAGDAPLVVLRRLFDLVLRAGSADIGVLVASSVVVALVARVLGLRALGAAVATTYLLVPLAVLKAAGGALALLDVRLWWLPHLAVDSSAVVVDGRVSWLRFTAKSVVAYGPALAVLLDWFAQARAGMVTVRPRAVEARRGLAFVLVAIAAVVSLSAISVLRHADQLRPRLAGDLLPSVPLRPLPGVAAAPLPAAGTGNRGANRRIDLVELARSPGTKVLVVDFWASWCGPCRRSLPELAAFARTVADRGVVVIGVNREPSDGEAALKSWRELAPGLATLVDDRGLGEKIGLTSLPSSYVVDHEGRIRHLHLGFTSIDTIRTEVEALLATSDGAR
jgi:thiol-disulfide isomerase/thioredoxin